MTCIVGLQTDDGVYMAADSVAWSRHEASTVLHPKIFPVGELLIGYTSTFRFGQLLQYRLDMPEHVPGETDMQFLMNVVTNIRKLLEEAKHATVSNSVAEGGQALIAYRGQLYCLQTDFSIIAYKEPMDGVGSGLGS